jgi:hypothetical protein
MEIALVAVSGCSRSRTSSLCTVMYRRKLKMKAED